MTGAVIEVTATPRQRLGMPPSRFLAEYWQKRPLLIRGAYPGDLAPLDPGDLAGLACEPYALARIVRYERDVDRWALSQGPFEEQQFPGMPQQDWTLLVQDVDKWDDDVRAMLRDFSFLPSWRIDDIMVSFAAPGGSVGPHVDQYDVFLVQGLGRRRWQISTDVDASRAFRSDSELRILESFEPTHDWVVEPGDMLYLPPGVPHFGEAMDACLTYSVGMRAPSMAEMVADLADHLAERDEESRRYADPDLVPTRHPGEIDAASLQRARRQLRDLADMDDAAMASWLGRLFSRYRSGESMAAPPTPPGAGHIARRLERGARLVRNPLSRMAYVRCGRHARLFALGQEYAVPLSLARTVCDGEGIDEALWKTSSDATRASIQAMATEGHLVFQRS